MFSDVQLSTWTKPAFGNEEQLASSTEKTIRDAIKSHHILSSLDIRILPKGSFKNNTNVRRNSDIDIAIVNQDLIVTEYAQDNITPNPSLVPYTGISKENFKAAIGEALQNAFGASVVDRSGNKVFKIRGSKKVIDADVIPSTQYWYIGKGWVRKGIGLILDQPDGKAHFNYPDQHFNNGVKKNNSTGRRYKSTVRILKNIKNKLVTEGYITDFPSFLIECLAYNVPDNIYNTNDNWRSILTNLCVSIWGYVDKADEPNDLLRWTEVNGHKYLFGAHQNWSKQQTKDFILSVYRMITD
ncbi:nucleotidyltransferase [Legionella israelensis]|uniref:nucleotidyltransferase domain-containing protein n=1 Tax=Legionella israelensis TaxID=454 RepID=UPI001180B9D8|nr:nucleotidyltransferase [Legionella israelensis]QDP72144.1 nucleotidyltransferase [Legionella israelensis]